MDVPESVLLEGLPEGVRRAVGGLGPSGRANFLAARRRKLGLPPAAPRTDRRAPIFGAGIPLPAHTLNAPRSLFAEGIDLS